MTIKRRWERRPAWAGLTLVALVGCSAAQDDSIQATGTEDEFGSVSAAVIQSKRYGSWCQPGEYQFSVLEGGPWLATTGCEENDALHLAFGATRHHYYNLEGGGPKFHWEANGDSGLMEQVDLVFYTGHGGARPTTIGSVYAAWDDGYADQNRMIWTRNMQLGDATPTQRGTSVLATAACDTLAGNIDAEFGRSYRAGLRMVVGSHGDYGISRTGSVGQNFGIRLKAGATIASAWYVAMHSTTQANDTTISASGNSEADCYDRMNSMTWNNFDSKPRRIGTNYTTWCYTRWEDL